MWTGLSLNAMGREPEDRVDRADIECHGTREWITRRPAVWTGLSLNAMGREPEDRVDRAELECHGEGARGPCGQG